LKRLEHFCLVEARKGLKSMAITNKDIEKLKEHFATKEDLKQFATKEDLKRFATKEDLKQFATKADLEDFRREVRENFATKAELRQFRDEVMSGLDAVMGELKNMREERYMMKARVDRIEEKLDAHIKAPVSVAHAGP